MASLHKSLQLYLANLMIGRNTLPMYLAVCNLIDDRLVDDRPTADTQYLNVILKLFKNMVKRMYHTETSNEYVNARKVFEKAFEDYVYQCSLKFFIEEVCDHLSFMAQHNQIGITDLPDEVFEILKHDGIVKRDFVEN